MEMPSVVVVVVAVHLRQRLQSTPHIPSDDLHSANQRVDTHVRSSRPVCKPNIDVQQKDHHRLYIDSLLSIYTLFRKPSIYHFVFYIQFKLKKREGQRRVVSLQMSLYIVEDSLKRMNVNRDAVKRFHEKWFDKTSSESTTTTTTPKRKVESVKKKKTTKKRKKRKHKGPSVTSRKNEQQQPPSIPCKHVCTSTWCIGNNLVQTESTGVGFHKCLYCNHFGRCLGDNGAWKT